ncbi:unnamed protein product [Callosobruchus maculatus]|uniref:Uncharacterized protein n=1 Tax=Callosobruchus maculatus TaxID=64391 RepID=A0A653BGM8_CALMS|nr:unnamed protein product [Callosobruchus maculatus]
MLNLVLLFIGLCSTTKFVHAVDEEVQALMDNLHNECLGQTGVDENLILNARKGEFPEDPKLKCYMRCILNEIGTIEDDGSIDVDGVLAVLPEEFKDQAEPVFRKCANIGGSDPCDIVFLTNKCAYAENPSEKDKLVNAAHLHMKIMLTNLNGPLKLLLLFCFATKAMGLSEEMQELADMLHKTCVEETSANEDDISNARRGQFADDEKFKCYIFCIMAQMACIEDDGTIDEEATIAVLPDEFKDKAAPIVRKCGTIKGATPCESAWLTHKCYQSEAPDLINFLYSCDIFIIYLLLLFYDKYISITQPIIFSLIQPYYGFSEHEMMSNIKNLGLICDKTFSVSDAIKEDVNNHRIWSDDENFKCYLHCMMQEASVFTPSGTVDEDACIDYLADNYRDEFIPIIRRCGTKKGANDCETAWLTNQCWAESPRVKYGKGSKKATVSLCLYDKNIATGQPIYLYNKEDSKLIPTIYWIAILKFVVINNKINIIILHKTHMFIILLKLLFNRNYFCTYYRKFHFSINLTFISFFKGR